MASVDLAGRSAGSRLGRIARRVSDLTGFKRVAAGFGAGALASLALPPLDAWPTLLIGLAVLLWLLDGIARRETLKARLALAFLVGWSFGFGYFVVSLYWIGFAFLVEADVFAVLLPFGVAGLPAFLALYWGLAAAAAVPLWQPGLARVIALAAMLAAFDWLRGHLFTGFPWNAPGYAASALDGLAQIAAYVGTPALTLLVLLWAGAATVVVETLFDRTRSNRSLIVTLAVVASAPAAWFLGFTRLPDAPAPMADGVSIRIVQANISQADKWKADRAEEVLATYERLSRTPGAAGITHLVWPESALPMLVDERPPVRLRLAALLSPGAHLLMGALRREAGADPDAPKVFNSVLALDDSGEVAARYDKWRLVPFGEFLPLARYLEPLGLRKLVPLPGSFEAGEGPATLHLDSTPPFGPLICYEAIFPRSLVETEDRPQWLLNVTNDGWFGISAGPYQHLAQARFRAIEQGLPLVRAANTGISAVIDPYGRVLKSLPLGTEGVLDSPLPRPLAPTLYAQHGDIALLVVLLGCVLIFGTSMRAKAAPRNGKKPVH
ncbi:MAG: apolipoprotein N-acyltransferase [Parvibaculaceae bacterium]